MNCVYKALIHSSECSRGRWILSLYRSYCTSKPQLEFERPKEIPFQPKVANYLNFIGVVQSPVQFLASRDGSYWAGTVISQLQPSHLPLSIPVVFEGDLAHTAACHLKENDNVYIAGHLSADKLPLSFKSNQDCFQVMVHSLNFVQGYSNGKNRFRSDQKDLIPNKSSKPFIPVTGSKALDTDWEDLVNNPKEWRDFRSDKINKVVNPKYPDFKNIEDGRALWLNTAPRSIVVKLEGLAFNNLVGMTKKSQGHRDSEGSPAWKDLIENPSKWWDNRACKPTIRHPDFKHKDTRDVLWLDKAPEWVMEKLPPANANAASTGS